MRYVLHTSLALSVIAGIVLYTICFGEGSVGDTAGQFDQAAAHFHRPERLLQHQIAAEFFRQAARAIGGGE